jgi:hypothetical protein
MSQEKHPSNVAARFYDCHAPGSEVVALADSTKPRSLLFRERDKVAPASDQWFNPAHTLV